jgi:phosphatidylserine decarboxylase
LGIRLLYNGLDKAKTKRVRKLLKQLSIKQGVKFDNPLLKNDIPSFVKFHGLDMSDCVEPDYNRYDTFNEFFYRKLRHGTRPIDAPKDPRIAVSPADCRCATFSTVTDATEFWIKGRNFTVAKLFNGNFDGYENTDLYNGSQCSLGIFRLAPQDYHRFHCPVDGTIGNIKHIDGEYYTVNPMAIRSSLDVYGENVRSIIPIKTENFGTVVMIAVGAMMVGSTVLTVENNQTVRRGDEIGYFKFGGSTILLLFEKSKFTFDSDLLNNSNSSVETLIRVGQSIGHSPEVDELPRDRVDFYKQSKDFRLKLIRNLTGGGTTTAAELAEWESKNIKVTDEDFQEIVKSTMDEKSEESDFDEEGLISSE